MESGDVDHLQVLLQGGPLPTPTDVGRTLLHSACEQGCAGCVPVLISAGADPVALYDGWSPLQTAAACGHANSVDALLRISDKARAAIDHRKGEANGRTALHLACVAGAVDVVRCLLRYGASLAVTDSSGCNALQLAEENEQREVADTLRSASAQPVRETTTVAAPKVAHLYCPTCGQSMPSENTSMVQTRKPDQQQEHIRELQRQPQLPQQAQQVQPRSRSSSLAKKSIDFGNPSLIPTLVSLSSHTPSLHTIVTASSKQFTDASAQTLCELPLQPVLSPFTPRKYSATSLLSPRKGSLSTIRGASGSGVTEAVMVVPNSVARNAPSSDRNPRDSHEQRVLVRRLEHANKELGSARKEV